MNSSSAGYLAGHCLVRSDADHKHPAQAEEGTFTVKSLPVRFSGCSVHAYYLPLPPPAELLKNLVIRDDILNIYLKKKQLVTLTDGLVNELRELAGGCYVTHPLHSPAAPEHEQESLRGRRTRIRPLSTSSEPDALSINQPN